MIKTFTSILFALLLSMGVMAQENQKNWRDGKLTWLDFSEKESNQGVSELKYSQNPLAAELFICA